MSNPASIRPLVNLLPSHRILFATTLGVVCLFVLLGASPALAVGITTTDPVTNEVGVDPDADIVATYDAAIKPTTVTTDTFVAQGMMRGLRGGDFTFSGGDTIVTLNPDEDYFTGEVVRVSATGGISDTGDSPVTPYQWQFTAGPVFPRCVDGFSDIEAGLTGVRNSSVAWGDYDNDGYLDILLTGNDDPDFSHPVSKVYRNNWDGTDGPLPFSEIGAGLTPVLNSSVAWGDYDNDGYLDILLTGYDGSNRVSEVWRNKGDGTFEEKTSDGLTPVSSGSVAWGDYDNDGYLDILLTGDKGSSPWRISRVYRNNGDDTFTENTRAGLPGVAYSSVAWGDYDNDGYLDILITGTIGWPTLVSRVYRNLGDGTFSDIAAGLDEILYSSVAWGDYDNDGYLDILLAGQYTASGPYVSQVYRNNWDGTDGPLPFSDIGAGLPGVVYCSVAWGDYDNDGDLDILLTGQDGDGGKVAQVWQNDDCAPDPGIVKWVEPETGVTYHSTVTYTVVMSNTGGPSQVVYLTDTLPAEVEFAQWVEQSGATENSGEITWTGTVNAIETITWTWLVTHTGDYGDVVTNTAWYAHDGTMAGYTATFAVKGEPEFSLAKSAAPDSDVDYGGQVTYTVTVSNTGPSPAVGLLMTDTLSEYVEFARWVEQHGATETDDEITWTGTVTENDSVAWSWVVSTTYVFYSETITNAAWYEWDGETGGYTATFKMKDPPKFDLVKTAEPAEIDFHGTVTYTVSVTNTGPSLAEVGTLVDVLPTEWVTFSHWITQNGATENEGLITWAGRITDSARLDWSWVVTHTGYYGDVVTNTAIIIDGESGAQAQAEAGFEVEGPPALVVSKQAQPPIMVDYHGVVTYSVMLTNLGEADAHGTLLTDTLPGEVDFGYWVGDAHGATVAADKIRWTGTVTGGTGQVQWTWVVTHTGGYGDVVTNTIEVAHPNSGQTDEADAVFKVKTASNLTVTKTAVPEADVDYHGLVGYTVALYNTGETDAAGVLLTDTLPGKVEFAEWLAQNGATESNDEITWSGTVTANQGIGWMWIVTHTGDYSDVVTNLVKAAHPGTGQAVQNSATFTVTTGPSLEIDKEATPSLLDLHGVVTYTVNLRNTGNSAAESAYMTDVLLGEVEFARWISQSGALESDDTITWSGTLSPSKEITWTWLVTHTGGYGEVVTNTARYTHWYAGTGSDKATFTVKTAPSLTLTKYVTPQSGVEFGDEVTYTVTIQNAGQSLASGVSLSDTLPSLVGFDHWVQQSGATIEAGSVISWFGNVTASETVGWSWVVTCATGSGSVVNTAECWYGGDQATASATFGGAVQPLYLPVVLKNIAFMPDLVVDDLSVDANTVTVVIRNAGNAPTVEDFWVDVSFDPEYRPPRINQPWQRIADHGVVWGVVDSLPVGGSLTLVNNGGDPYYFPNLSSAPPLPVGQEVYAYVDSVDWATTWGAVRESNEGNNTAGPVVSTAGAGPSPGSSAMPGGRETGNLPPR